MSVLILCSYYLWSFYFSRMASIRNPNYLLADNKLLLRSDQNKSSTNRSLSTTSESNSSVSSFSPLASPAAVSPLSKLNEKLGKIQEVYIEIACRYLQDEFGLTVGRRMFHNLVPLLFGRLSCVLTSSDSVCKLRETVLDSLWHGQF